MNLKQKRIYIAGQVTGLSRRDYYNNFGLAELQIIFAGNVALNPVTICEQAGVEDYGACMLLCIQALKTSDGVYFLNNWHKSKGANIEKEVVDLLKVINPDYEISYQEAEK